MTGEADFWLRWDRFVDHLLGGSVVPIAGAGLSLRCVARDRPDVVPDVKAMKRAMGKKLVLLRRKLRDREQLRAELGVASLDEGAFEACALDKLAEVLSWYTVREDVVKAANIHEFHLLAPGAAHHALVRLAREGLIAELITTNYDLCFEKAFRQSLPPEDRLNDRHGVDGRGFKGWHPVVIRSAAEARERRWRKVDPHRRPALHLYKINGCAERFNARVEKPDTRHPSPGDEIVLSEAQLQTFGWRTWARDYFRDRARSAHLITTGFGADEPQVRYTFHEITAELAEHEPDPSSPGSGNRWELGNAPWVQAWEPYPSYAQAHLLRAWISGGRRAAGGPAALDLPNANFFGGADATWLVDNGPGRLDGGVFWRAAHAAAWLRLAQLESRPQGRLYLWLEGVRPGLSGWGQQLMNWLRPTASARPEQPKDARARRLGRSPGLLGSDTAEHPHGELADWVEAIFDPRRRSTRDPDTNIHAPYPALHDDPLTPLLTLLAVWLLADREISPTDAAVGPAPAVKATPEGLWIRTDPHHAVLALADDEVVKLPSRDDLPPNVLVILLPRRTARARPRCTNPPELETGPPKQETVRRPSLSRISYLPMEDLVLAAADQSATGRTPGAGIHTHLLHRAARHRAPPRRVELRPLRGSAP